MAPQAVEWVLRLVDRMSAPARAAQQRIQGVERAMQRAERMTRAAAAPFRAWATAGESSARRVENAMRRVGNRVSQTSQGLQGLVQGLGMVGFAAAGVGYGTYSVGKAVLGGMAGREGDLMSLETLLKKEPQVSVRGAADYIGKFADITPFEDKDVMASVRQLLASQFKFEQVKGIARITGDAASALGSSTADAAFKWEIINRALGQIKSKGRVQGDEILQLQEAGINASKYLEAALGKNYLKLQEAGKISANVGISAILAGLQDDFGGSMEKMSKTFSGLTSTLASRPQRMLATMFDQGALDQPKRLMENLVSLTDFEKEPGKRILSRLTAIGKRVTDGLFGPLADATSGERGIQTIDRLLDKLDEYAGWWEKNGPRIAANVRGFGEGLAAAGKVAETALKPLVWVVNTLDRLSGGSGEGGLGKVLGFGAGMAAIGWLGNLLSFGMLGKLGGMAGQTLAGAMRTGLTRAWANRGFAQWGLGAFMRAVRGVGLMQALGLGGVGSLFARLTPLVGRFTGFFARLAPLAARFMPWLARIGTAFLGLSNPIGWVVTAVTLIGTLGAALYQKWSPFRDFVDRLGDGFREAADSAVAWFGSIPDKLRGLGARLYETILPQWVRDGLSRVGINLAASPVQSPAPAALVPAPASANASVNALTGVAQRIGIDPNALLAVAFKESSLNPAAVNKESGASGLIQFLPSTARALGTTVEALRRMTPEQQAPLIEQYLKGAGVKSGASLEQVYAAVFAGSASKTGRVLYTTADGKAYSDNVGLDLNKDGRITSGEAAQSAGDAWRAAAPQFAPTINVIVNGPVTGQGVTDIGNAAGAAVGTAFGQYGLELGAGGAL